MNSFLISYSRVNLKLLMELKYVSLYKIIFYIGIIGCILISICLIITSIFQCHESHKNGDDEKVYSCRIQYKNTSSYYFDSFPAYISEMNNIKINNTNYEIYAFWSELFAVTPLKICAWFFECLFEILLIYYLNPIYILVSDCIYYGSLLVFQVFQIIIFDNDTNSETKTKVILRLIAQIISLFLELSLFSKLSIK